MFDIPYQVPSRRTFLSLSALSAIAIAASPEMPDAFAYHGQQMYVSRRDGDVTARTQRRIEAKNQFALEIDHFSQCILADRRPHTPGEEGLQDQKLMAAIYRSAAEGRPVEMPQPPGPTRGPEPAQGG